MAQRAQQERNSGTWGLILSPDVGSAQATSDPLYHKDDYLIYRDGKNASNVLKTRGESGQFHLESPWHMEISHWLQFPERATEKQTVQVHGNGLDG